MTDGTSEEGGLEVPRGRLSRLGRVGGLASGVAGSMAWHGARRVVRGERPALRDLLLTPANATRIADELARMRGAAMKVGQLLSMEAGEVLPPELADILARLRAEAHYMPPRQLKSVLVANWGTDFLKRFRRFDVRPIAAASIGQVHRAVTRDGRELAVKVQYPGVRESIDSDVANLAGIVRMSGMVPRGLDLGPLFDEARRQLHEEADYEREGRYLQRFAGLLAEAPEYRVPALDPELTTPSILAMEYVAGAPIDGLAEAPEAERNAVVARLIALVLRELFEFRLMQTDPNFANYLHDRDGGQVVLLDFGASRDIPEAMAAAYRRLLRAGMAGDAAGMRDAAGEIGVFGPETPAHHADAMLEMMEMAFAPLRSTEVFDFGDGTLAARMRERGMALGMEGDFATIPPVDTLYLQRKVGGMYLLASRLKAKVALRPLVEPWL